MAFSIIRARSNAANELRMRVSMRRGDFPELTDLIKHLDTLLEIVSRNESASCNLFLVTVCNVVRAHKLFTADEIKQVIRIAVKNSK